MLEGASSEKVLRGEMAMQVIPDVCASFHYLVSFAFARTFCIGLLSIEGQLSASVDANAPCQAIVWDIKIEVFRMTCVF